MRGYWINFNNRQEIISAVFLMVMLLITLVCLKELKDNLEGPVSFNVFVLCISLRLLTAGTKYDLFWDVIPAVVVSA